MTTYELGQTVTWAFNTYDAAGVLADIGTLPVAAITLPDGTATTGTVTKASTGSYVVTCVSAQAGRLRLRVTGTGANSTVSLPWSAVADVWPSDPRLIISLADARAALNLPATITANDDEIRLYVAAATEVIEDIVGPVLAASKVETVSGAGRALIALSEHPTAITSVVQDGVTLPATGYCFDEPGILWRGARQGAGVWSDAGPRNIVVTYTVGSGSIPPNIILAAREEVRFLYQRQQAPRPSFGASDVATSYTPSGYAVPNFVVEMCQPSLARKMPGFA